VSRQRVDTQKRTLTIPSVEGLTPLFPVAMHVDYVRLYQDPNKRNIGCDPKEYPTADYIAK
jgi:hypothetical protein